MDAERREVALQFDDVEAAHAERVLSSAEPGKSKRWEQRATTIRRSHSDEHTSLISRQSRKEGELRRKQHLTLLLIEKLKDSDAFRALSKLAQCAPRFTEQGKRLIAAHDQEWLQLFAAQRAAWRTAVQDEEVARFVEGRTNNQPQSAMSAESALASKMRRKQAMSEPVIQQVAYRRLNLLRQRLDESHSATRQLRKVMAIGGDADRISTGQLEIRLNAFKAVQRSNNTVTAPDARFERMADSLCSRWEKRVLAALLGQRQARDEMLKAQEQEEIDQRRRHRLILDLVERLIALAPLHALHRMVEVAKKAAVETHALLEKQGRDWLDLVAAQRKAWPPQPQFQDSGTSKHSAMSPIGSRPDVADGNPNGGSPALPRQQGETNAPNRVRAPIENQPIARPKTHMRIVEEMADWLVLKNARSSQRNLMMATYVGEEADAFDQRTNQRQQALLETAKSLGPGKHDSWAPRSPKEILSDPIVIGSSELHELVLQVGTRTKSPASSQKRQLAASVSMNRKAKEKQ